MDLREHANVAKKGNLLKGEENTNSQRIRQREPAAKTDSTKDGCARSAPYKPQDDQGL